MKLFPRILIFALIFHGHLHGQIQGQTLLVPHNVRGLQGDLGTPTVPVELPLAASMRPQPDAWRESLNSYLPENDALELSSIIAFMVDMEPDPVWNDGGIEDQISAGILWIQGPPSIQEQVDQAIKPLLERRQRTLRATVRSLAKVDEAEIPGIVLGQNDANTLATKSPITVAVDLRTGRTTRLAAQRTRALVGDYNVEVAEKSAIADPVVIAMPEGFEMDLRVRPAPEGKLFVEWTARASLSDTPLTTETPYGQLSLPRCDSLITAGSALMTNGGGVVVGSRKAGGPWLLTVDGPAIESAGIECAPLLTPHRRFRLPVTVGVVPSSGSDAVDDDCEEESESLVDWDALQQNLGCEGTEWADWDDAIWIRNDQERLASGRKSAASLVQQIARTVGVDVRWGLLSPEEVTASDAASLAKKLDHTGRLCGRLGDDLLLVAGKEQNYVRDYDVEIASDSQIGDVIVSTLFEGLGLRLRVDEAPNARALLTGDLAFQLVQPIAEFTPSEPSKLGPVQTPMTRMVTANPRASMAADAWHVLHVGSLGPEAPSFVIVVRPRL